MMRAASIPTIALAALALAGRAEARPLESELPPKRAACWERSYDAAHLAAHPRQKVGRIRLVHLPDDWKAEPSRGFFVVLYMNLRERVKATSDYDYQISGFCKPRGQGVHCVPEWEAGSWRIERGPGGALDIRNGGIIANPNPYDAEEIADDAVRIPAKPDDGVWRLMPATGACRIE
ncbi:MAG TPA: hypothetical protein VGN82_06620 [Bosea sp. (in: a-proteobacteria)]|jgi:hypothetical protein|uniref:hypothetical protein n=1 Tax=Bosea sp. (in: a-proteobacteria) TaxID=1871050 RepID=UPI002E128760|nr:hypothetical protein [Bosea sp. (in: a-proteobacteria)]